MVDRREKLAAQLRENLKQRKAQQKLRKEEGAVQTTPPQSPEQSERNHKPDLMADNS